MKITIDQPALKAALAPVERATAAGNTPLTALKNVLIDASGGRIRLTGSDDVTAVTTTVDGTIEQPGSTTVDAAMLVALVATLPAAPITIASITEHKVSVQATGGHTILRAIPADDYPIRPIDPEMVTTAVVTMPAAYLGRLIDRVAISAAKEQSRPQLYGIHLRVRDGILHLWGADGFRVSAQQFRLEADTPDSATTVPAVSLRQLAKILATTGGDVTLGVTENRTHLVADTGEVAWAGKLVDGEYPDVLAVLPKEMATTAVVGRESVLWPLKRSMLITKSSSEKHRGVVQIRVAGSSDDLTPGTLEVAGYDLSGAETVTSVDSSIDGPDVQLTINGPMLADALGAFDGPQVQLGFNGPVGHLTLRAPGNPDHTQLVVPMVVSAQ